jgi:pyruvate dehydrogenase E1 component alpha subunit
VTADELRAFEKEVAEAFEAKRIHAPIHLSGGNEEALIRIFQFVPKDAWVLSTWRSHYHALLHGVPPDLVMKEILAGRSMMLHFPEYHFLTSAIVGGILSIACGIAASGQTVYAFVGDMAASTGMFHDAQKYARGHDLPVTFVVEDNGLATNTPTQEAWGKVFSLPRTIRYEYTREHAHVGSGKYVAF